MSDILRFELNGHPVEALVRGGDLLLDVLRDRLGQTGTKEGCGKGECGACTVLIDDEPFNACLVLAHEVEDRRVTTVEGLAGPGGALSPVQEAFVGLGAIQCGFCSPGMILSAHALLARNSEPTEAEIRRALVGNLCRCTGYAQIVAAVQAAAEGGSA